MNAIAHLPGYQILERLHVSSHTLVSRAIRESDRRPVVLKVLGNPFPSFNDLVRFRNQYVITKNLDSPYIVRPLVLERYGKGYALVMPDERAVSLADYWQQFACDLSEFFTIAIQLAEALHHLARGRIIHKDLKPSHILIQPESGQIQLIDFSISSLLPKEQQQFTNPNVLEGTLAYISPEQTGRMNRGVDYRTDYYSLGVTFYELLTGRLPFESDDPLELVHAHIAKTPPDPQPPIPNTLGDIVRKLMAKNTEDRYQSARGLKYDLEQGLTQWQATGTIAPFALGERDICDRFLIPEKLYGREKKCRSSSMPLRARQLGHRK